MRPRPLPAMLLALALGGCAAQQSTRIGDAAKSPLADLNVGQASIPPRLQDAQKQPYRTPAEGGCPALAADVAALDALLGPDIDTVVAKAQGLDGAAALVDDTAVDVFKGAVEGLVPYRSWIRKLSGAERFSREVATAVQAGALRRAFLKGLMRAAGCQ